MCLKKLFTAKKMLFFKLYKNSETLRKVLNYSTYGISQFSLFTRIFYCVDPFWIRIRILNVAECGSNLDQDPQHWLKCKTQVPQEKIKG